MRVMVTGRTGQVGHYIHESLGHTQGPQREFELLMVGRAELDFDAPGELASTLDRLQPDLIVNCAAWTAVDAAQTQPEAAMRANRDAPMALAQWCAAQGAGLVHLSTDYVFDGSADRPYRPTDPCSPLGIYGATKRAGEEAIAASGATAAVFRTSWVVSPFGKNFLLTMLRFFREREHMRVVADQVGCPTDARALARWLSERVIKPFVAQQSRARGVAWLAARSGVFHLAGAGETSWHGLASAIHQEACLADAASIKTRSIEAISTDQFPTPTPRPANSRLDCATTIATFGASLGPWASDVRASVRVAIEASRSAAQA